MTDETQTAWMCPKDGTVMQSQGRRSGAWRCPTSFWACWQGPWSGGCGDART